MVMMMTFFMICSATCDAHSLSIISGLPYKACSGGGFISHSLTVKEIMHEKELHKH